MLQAPNFPRRPREAMRRLRTGWDQRITPTFCRTLGYYVYLPTTVASRAPNMGDFTVYLNVFAARFLKASGQNTKVPGVRLRARTSKNGSCILNTIGETHPPLLQALG